MMTFTQPRQPDTVKAFKAGKLAYNGHINHEETWNNVRCTQVRKTTHGLDGQYRDVDRTLRGRVSQNDRGQG